MKGHPWTRVLLVLLVLYITTAQPDTGDQQTPAAGVATISLPWGKGWQSAAPAYVMNAAVAKHSAVYAEQHDIDNKMQGNKMNGPERARLSLHTYNTHFFHAGLACCPSGDPRPLVRSCSSRCRQLPAASHRRRRNHHHHHHPACGP